MASKPLDHDPTDKDLVVSAPKKSAVGVPSLLASIPLALDEMGPVRAVKTLRHMNQKDGFDCPSCAWPDPPNRKVAEFCEKGPRRWRGRPIRSRCRNRSGRSTRSPNSRPKANTGWGPRAGSSSRSTSPPEPRTTARFPGTSPWASSGVN